MKYNLLSALIGFGIGVCLMYTLTPRPSPKVERIVDTLKIENNIIKDSIIYSDIKIKYLKEEYEKALIDITNQSIADDAMFFAKHVSEGL